MVSSGFSFYCFNSLRISHFKACIHKLERRCFSLYIILLMILQLGGFVNLIGGITTATSAADYFQDSETANGKLDFCYPWSNREISVTDWRNLRKEWYKHYSHQPEHKTTVAVQALFSLNWTQNYSRGTSTILTNLNTKLQ